MANLEVNIDGPISENRDIVRAVLTLTRLDVPSQQGFNLQGKVCGIAIAPDSDVPEVLVRVTDEQSDNIAFVGLGQSITTSAPLVLSDGSPIQNNPIGASGLEIIIPYHMRVMPGDPPGNAAWLANYQPTCNLLLYMRPPAQIPLGRVDKSDQLQVFVTSPAATINLWKLYVANRKRVDLIIGGPVGGLVGVVGRIYPLDNSQVFTPLTLMAPTAIPAGGFMVIPSINPSACTEIVVTIAHAGGGVTYDVGYRISDQP